MKRLGALLCLVLIVTPLGVHAQQAGAVSRVAVLCPNRCEGPSYEAFRGGLRDHGWIDGQSIVLDGRGRRLGGSY